MTRAISISIRQSKYILNQSLYFIQSRLESQSFEVLCLSFLVLKSKGAFPSALCPEPSMVTGCRRHSVRPIDQTGLIVFLPVSSKLLCLTVESGACKACNTERVGLPAAVPIWKGRTAFLMTTGRPSPNAPAPRRNAPKLSEGSGWIELWTEWMAMGSVWIRVPSLLFALLVTIVSWSVKMTTTEHHGYWSGYKKPYSILRI